MEEIKKEKKQRDWLAMWSVFILTAWLMFFLWAGSIAFFMNAGNSGLIFDPNTVGIVITYASWLILIIPLIWAILYGYKKTSIRKKNVFFYIQLVMNILITGLAIRILIGWISFNEVY